MLVEIKNIKIKKRIRIDIGNLDQLKESLEKYGQFHPITLNDKYELISGFRRLESAKLLGWNTIEATIIGNPGKQELIERELEENLVRKNFTDNELQDAYHRLKKLQNPNFLISIIKKISTLFRTIFSQKKS